MSESATTDAASPDVPPQVTSDETPQAAIDATAKAILAVPSIPHRGDAPVFQAPWEAEAFAMVLALHQGGLFTWPEWANTLSGAIIKAQRDGDPDLGDTYYLHWLTALEEIVLAKGVGDRDQLAGLVAAWQQAADSTPHGQPIELSETISAKLLK